MYHLIVGGCAVLAFSFCVRVRHQLGVGGVDLPTLGMMLGILGA